MHSSIQPIWHRLCGRWNSKASSEKNNHKTLVRMWWCVYGFNYAQVLVYVRNTYSWIFLAKLVQHTDTVSSKRIFFFLHQTILSIDFTISDTCIGAVHFFFVFKRGKHRFFSMGYLQFHFHGHQLVQCYDNQILVVANLIWYKHIFSKRLLQLRLHIFNKIIFNFQSSN